MAQKVQFLTLLFAISRNMFTVSFVIFKVDTKNIIIKEAFIYVYSKVKMLAFDNGGTKSNVTVLGTGLILFTLLYFILYFFTCRFCISGTPAHRSPQNSAARYTR